MTARLPHDKTEELRVVIRAWARKKWCTRKELESLVGKLNHACAVVAHDRTFLRRMINLLWDSKPRRRYIRLNKPCQLVERVDGTMFEMVERVSPIMERRLIFRSPRVGTCTRLRIS